MPTNFMINLRKYGNAPFRLVVLHGGPGAPGYMAPVARELSRDWSVLEPLQTATSLEGQILELKTVLDRNAQLPAILIGSSWGAMLAFIFTSRYPEYTKQLILIGSAVFEEKYEEQIMQTRMSRLSEADKAEAYSLTEQLHDPFIVDKNTPFARLAELLVKSDSFNPLTLDIELLEAQHELNQSVWRDAETVRATGELLEMAKQIRCPVLAIHGDYDPHPVDGVCEPLSRVLDNFQFFLLKNCGHYPWIEREAKDRFYEIIRAQVNLQLDSIPTASNGVKAG